MARASLISIRNFGSKVAPTFFVTTPIYYVNAKPHIGHLYSSVIADAAARWQHLTTAGKIKLSTGTDEHGSKIQQAAAMHNSTPSEYCDRIAAQYKNLASAFNVNYTDFIRTTDETHRQAVHGFWNRLKSNGAISSAKYSGWYCVSDETFLTESQLKEKTELDGRKTMISGESGHPVEWTEEVNYMFPLQSFQDDLRYWINREESRVRPAKFQKILLDMVDGGPLPAISISRPASRVHWGIRVPDDETQTVYVWLDALVNYLTAAGYPTPTGSFSHTWPPNLQVIGKDILKFHGIYWPAFLMAAKLEPPQFILCHSHWTVDGEKMSKSKNNVVCPLERSEIYTGDGLRYFLLREGVAHSDGNYSDTKVIRILNAELADTLGNLLSRCCGTALNPNQTFPAIEPSAFRAVASKDVTKKLIDGLIALPGDESSHSRRLARSIPDQMPRGAVMQAAWGKHRILRPGNPHQPSQKFAFISEMIDFIEEMYCVGSMWFRLECNVCLGHYSEYNFYKAVDSIIGTLHQANLFFETLKPWELKKCTDKRGELDVVLHITLETLRVCGVLLTPIIPNIAENLLNKINVPANQRFFRELYKLSWDSEFATRPLSPLKTVLFKRILLEGGVHKGKNATATT